MARRTTYTSTITVPVYASWKCPKCGEKNFSFGNIIYQRQASSSSLRSSKQNEAKERASSMAQSEWKDNALEIIFNPRKDATKLRENLFIQNTNCTKCNAKPKWDRGTGYATILALSILPAIFSGIFAFLDPTSIVAWVIFAASIGAFIYGIASGIIYRKRIASMPDEHLPVIGSLNEELIEYAALQGKSIPTPNETMRIVEG